MTASPRALSFGVCFFFPHWLFSTPPSDTSPATEVPPTSYHHRPTLHSSFCILCPFGLVPISRLAWAQAVSSADFPRLPSSFTRGREALVGKAWDAASEGPFLSSILSTDLHPFPVEI